MEEPGGVGGVSASWGGLSFAVLIVRGIQPQRGGCFLKLLRESESESG